jgi:hypothetical protein
MSRRRLIAALLGLLTGGLVTLALMTIQTRSQQAEEHAQDATNIASNARGILRLTEENRRLILSNRNAFCRLKLATILFTRRATETDYLPPALEQSYRRGLQVVLSIPSSRTCVPGSEKGATPEKAAAEVAKFLAAAALPPLRPAASPSAPRSPHPSRRATKRISVAPSPAPKSTAAPAPPTITATVPAAVSPVAPPAPSPRGATPMSPEPPVKVEVGPPVKLELPGIRHGRYLSGKCSCESSEGHPAPRSSQTRSSPPRGRSREMSAMHTGTASTSPSAVVGQSRFPRTVREESAWRDVG